MANTLTKEKEVVKEDKVDKEKIASLVLQMEDDDFETREAATKELIAMGGRVVSELEKIKNTENSVEIKVRLEHVLKKIKWNIQYAETIKKMKAKKEWREYAEKDFIVVKTAEELERKLGSNRVIVIENEENAIDLTTIQREYSTSGFTSLGLSKLSNLVIMSIAEKPMNMYTVERFDDVVVLDECHSIIFENIEFGHQVEKGHCEGGVVVIRNSKKISFKGCEFFGCGTRGLDIKNCEEVTVKDSIVRECTYNAMWINNSERVFFSKCKIYNNEEFEVFGIKESEVVFEECEVTNNYGEVIFDLDKSKVVFNKGVVKGNRVNDFYNRAKSGEVDFDEADVKNNSMDVVLKEWKWTEDRNAPTPK